ncbi:TonB-dependent receptor [Maribacter sp. Asnod1-A12]|uniref:TonB-dependent receptor n=1 Tax=Maribacter sp. Asnod1-A12 TaxID=3160576 RepID=UPI0038700B3F
MKPFKNKINLLSFLLLFSSIGISAQNIKGKITDANNQALPGVNIILQGTNIGTASNFDGNFSIEITPENKIIILSYLGFKKKLVTITESDSELIIVMEEDASQLEGVIVTANQTAQSSQKVAQSISVIGPKLIQRTGAKEFRDFASGIPNLSFGTQGGDAGGRFNNDISIRGISGDGTSAMYLNGAPLPESISPNLIDVSRIEVLKGPQGTLYGSSTMGGAVKVITNKPSVFETTGFIEADLASVKEGDLDYNLQGLINIPLSDKLAFRASGYYNFQSGIYDRVSNKSIDWLNDDTLLTEDFYGDTEDYNGDDFNIITNGCEGCSREDKENVDDKRNYGFNANLGFYPSDNVSIIGTVIHQRLEGDGYDFAEGDVDSFIQTSNTGLDETFEDQWTNYSLGINIDTEVGTITSSTNYLDRYFVETEDVSDINSYWWIEYDEDPGEVPLTSIWGGTVDRGVDSKLFQQEIRFNSDFDGKFNFVAGGFYATETQDWNYQDDRTGLATYLLSDNAWFSYPDPNPDTSDPDYEDETAWGDTEADYNNILNNNELPWYSYKGKFKDSEFALFGQFYYDITEKLKFTLGLRYFNATLEKDINETGADFGFVFSPFSTKFSESGVNPKFNLTYEIDQDKLIYATAAKGFRIGDSNELLPLFAQEELEEGEWPSEFGSDYIWNYEIGFKGVWSNGKLISNLALFYNKWDNLQQYRLLDSGWGYTANVGSAHSAGLELELRGKLSKNFELGGGLGLLEPEIDEGSENLPADKGDKILDAASFTANINAEYTKQISENKSLYLRADLQHTGERFGTYEPEIEPELVYPSYTLINARIGYTFNKTQIALFGKNLTNTQANFGSISSFAGNLPGRERFATNRPITLGINIKQNF